MARMPRASACRAASMPSSERGRSSGRLWTWMSIAPASWVAPCCPAAGEPNRRKHRAARAYLMCGSATAGAIPLRHVNRGEWYADELAPRHVGLHLQRRVSVQEHQPHGLPVEWTGVGATDDVVGRRRRRKDGEMVQDAPRDGIPQPDVQHVVAEWSATRPRR